MTDTKKGNKSPLLIFILVLVALYLVYLLVVFLAKCFVYLGFNFFVFTDNLFEISAFNPVVTWCIMGLFLGSIAGVAIAIKKYRLSRKLIFYPVGLVLLLFGLLYAVNAPAHHDGNASFSSQSDYTTEPSTAMTTTSDFYISTQTVNARTGPSARYPVSFVLAKDEEVALIERGYRDTKQKEWIKINYSGQTGYVIAKYLRYSRTQ